VPPPPRSHPSPSRQRHRTVTVGIDQHPGCSAWFPTPSRSPAAGISNLRDTGGAYLSSRRTSARRTLLRPAPATSCSRLPLQYPTNGFQPFLQLFLRARASCAAARSSSTPPRRCHVDTGRSFLRLAGFVVGRPLLNHGRVSSVASHPRRFRAGGRRRSPAGHLSPPFILLIPSLLSYVDRNAILPGGLAIAVHIPNLVAPAGQPGVFDPRSRPGRLDHRSLFEHALRFPRKSGADPPPQPSWCHATGACAFGNAAFPQRSRHHTRRHRLGAYSIGVPIRAPFFFPTLQLVGSALTFVCRPGPGAQRCPYPSPDPATGVVFLSVIRSPLAQARAFRRSTAPTSAQPVPCRPPLCRFFFCRGCARPA